MPSKNKLMSELENLLKELNGNAEELNEASRAAISEQELVALQDRQNELLLQIQQTDRELEKLGGGPHKGVVWQRIQVEMERFQELNQKFIDNLTVRQGLIRFELKDLKRAQQALKEVEGSYRQGKGRKRLDTRS